MVKQLAKKGINYFELDRLAWKTLSHSTHDVVTMSNDEAKMILDSYSPNPKGCCLRNNLILPIECDLQIIVPTYNNDNYLEECMESILKQVTSYKYEVIVINDGSTDNTAQILKYYENIESIHIISQENRGFSGARNRGLEKINAQYIMFVDSDDRLPDGAIQALLETAFATDADIVDGSVYEFDKSRKTIKQKHKKKELVKNIYSLRGQPWGRVYKSYLFKNLVFPEGYWFEDTINPFSVFPNAHNAWIIPDFVYEYRNTPTGITATAGNMPKVIDTYWIFSTLLKTCNIHDQEYYNMIIRQIILNYKRTGQLPLEIQKAIFVLSADLVISYCDDYQPSRRYRDVYEAIKLHDFGYFSHIAQLWMFI